MKDRIKNKFSILLAKKPDLVVLFGILIFNAILILVAASIISSFALKGTEKMGLFEATFYTISMIFDAGCISYVVEDVGTTAVGIVILCLVVVVIGMVTFTGAVIGYVTNYISSFIEDANKGQHKIYATNHTVILNWNTKGNEILKDSLYKDEKSLIIVFVNKDKEKIQNEIEERLTGAIEKENSRLKERIKKYNFFKRHYYMLKYNYSKKITFIVREGIVFSKHQLLDISVDKAKSIIILDDYNNDVEDIVNEEPHSLVVKTLMQVADICAKDYSIDGQKIIVESNNKWTSDMINKIDKYKQNGVKDKIIALPSNDILGNILAQLTFMPELKDVYSELFSYADVDLYSKELDVEDGKEYIQNYLSNHSESVPIDFVDYENHKHFIVAGKHKEKMDIVNNNIKHHAVDFEINKKYKVSSRNIIILGHDNNLEGLLNGFLGVWNEWNNPKDKKPFIDVTIIDDKNSLESNALLFKRYPFIKKTIEAEIWEKEIFYNSINKIIDKNDDTNILILSNDHANKDNIDSNALTNLIYVQDIVRERKEKGKDVSKIDILVEIINPKHYSLVNNYSINNVVISNKFVSKLIGQISENDVINVFFKDILTYDNNIQKTKEIYVKPINEYFTKIPRKCTALDLIMSVYEKTKDSTSSIVLGYVDKKNKTHLFAEKLDMMEIDLACQEKIILYETH